MQTHLFRLVTLGAVCLPFLAAQPADDTVAKQVIIFGRHAIRTPILPNTALDLFSTQLFPDFGVSGQAAITPAGANNETLLGAYFRQWLMNEGLLTGHDSNDVNFVYFRANNTPLIVDTAQAFAAGMLPMATVNVDSYPQNANDPLFNPVAAGVAALDYQMAAAAVNGRLGGNPQTISTAYAAELALIRSVLFNYPVNQTPVPPTPPGKFDVTAVPITGTPGDSTLPVATGGLAEIAEAIDPFIQEYTDGLPAAEVGWGQLNAGSISQIYRLYDLLLDLEFRTPYLARVQSSNLASHIVRTLVQASNGSSLGGALGNPSTKVIVLTASNTNISGLAGLFNLDWLMPSYQRDVASLSGALVLELRQSQSTGAYIVRTTYVTQTMDQLRSQTLSTPPATAPVFIPGCSIDNATFDCPLSTLIRLEQQTVDPNSIALSN